MTQSAKGIRTQNGGCVLSDRHQEKGVCDVESSYFAVLAIVLSSASLVVSVLTAIFSRHQTRSAARSSMFERVADQCVRINDLFDRHEICGPIVSSLLDPLTEVERKLEFQRKAILFLSHLSLLADVFRHRKDLSSKEFHAYEDWAENVVGPWLNTDPELILLYRNFYNNHDMFGTDFAAWILPILQAKVPAA
jgi:hypothetical protein